MGAVLLGLQVKGRVLDAAERAVPEAAASRFGDRSLLTHGFIWPLAYVPFVLFLVIVIAGFSNGVNLTDGLDGLAIGAC